MKALLRILGYILMAVGGLLTISGGLTSCVMLISQDVTSWGERILGFLWSLIFTAGAATVTWFGHRLVKRNRRPRKSRSASTKNSKAGGNQPEEIRQGVQAKPLYAICTRMNDLPLCEENCLYLFTNQLAAQTQIAKLGMDYLYVQTIMPTALLPTFLEYYSAGYEGVILNAEKKLGLQEVCRELEPSKAGAVSPKTRNRMISYNQMRGEFLSKAKAENRGGLRTEEQETLERLEDDIIRSLLAQNLVLPMEKENGSTKIFVPTAKFPDGSCWVALFTDWSAVSAYIRKDGLGSAAFPGLIRDQYAQLKRDTSIKGILINPGREEFKIETAQLEQFLEPSRVDALLKECIRLQKSEPKSPRIPELKRQLAQELMKLDRLYVAYDLDFNSRFPFVDGGGRMEFFTTRERAEKAKSGYAERHEGRFEIRTIERRDYTQLLKELTHNGFYILRVDNGSMPVELELSMLRDSKPEGIVDRSNTGLRYLCIRDLEYTYRIRKLDASQKGTEREKGLQEMMLTMQANAYQMLGNSLVYVFGPEPYRPGVTLYTEKALARAWELCKKEKLPESSLLAPGDTSYETYTGALKLRVASKPGAEGLELSYCCAFTDRESAEEVRVSFEKSGCHDNVLVVTFDELHAQAVQCAGILLDMPTYGLELPKNEFEKILAYRDLNGGIIVSLKDQKPEEDTNP